MNESWACAGFEASGLFPVNRLCARKKCLDYIAKSSDGDVAVTAIQQAVLDVIMPQMSTETESIVKQRKKPRKRVQMKQAVLDVIMPQMSTETESIVKQRKKPRKRVQMKQAVLDVIMPQMSTETESIVKQRKKPRKRVQMKQAVLDVIMPQMSTETESIVKQRKKPRKRVQMKYGEVLTSPESMKRLKQHKKDNLKKSKRKAPQRKVILNKGSS